MSRPRIRSLKPECWQDERVGALGRAARLLFIGLITLADDEGRLRAQPSMLIGSLFPWDEVGPRELAKWLDEIVAEGLIVRYQDEGRPYVAFRNWKRHQRINRPSPSLLPPPPDHAIVRANSVNDAPADDGNSPNDHGTDAVKNTAPLTPSRERGSDREGKGEEPPRPPTSGGSEDATGGARGLRVNPRADGSNPRAVTERLALEKARADVASLETPTPEQRDAWAERYERLLADAPGSWAPYLAAAELVGTANGVLVVDGDDMAWNWLRSGSKAERLGPGVRIATADEHAGLRGAVAT